MFLMCQGPYSRNSILGALSKSLQQRKALVQPPIGQSSGNRDDCVWVFMDMQCNKRGALYPVCAPVVQKTRAAGTGAALSYNYDIEVKNVFAFAKLIPGTPFVKLKFAKD